MKAKKLKYCPVEHCRNIRYGPMTMCPACWARLPHWARRKLVKVYQAMRDGHACQKYYRRVQQEMIELARQLSEMIRQRREVENGQD